MQNRLYGQSSVKDILGKSESFMQSMHYDSSIFILEEGIKTVEKYGVVDSIGWLYLQLGHAYKLSEYNQEAFHAYSKSQEWFEMSQNSIGIGEVYVDWIEYYRSRQKYDEAKRYIELMQDLIKKFDLPLQLLGKYYSRCAAIAAEGDHDTENSRMFSYKVIDMANELNDNELLGVAYNEIGYSYENQENFQEALIFYNQAYDAWELDSNYRYMADVIANIGRCETRKGDYTSALETYKSGVILCDKYGLIKPKIEMLYYLHGLYEYFGDYKKSLEFYREYHMLLRNEEMLLKEKELQKIERKYDLDKQINITLEEKKRADYAEADSKNKTKQTYTWIGFSMALFVLLIIITRLVLKLKVNNKKLISANQQLELTITQKDVVFKELHHRVKNNLTLLKSMLFLHSKSSMNDEVKRALLDCQTRIDSMSVVHENLYETDDTTNVKFTDFVKQLVSELEESMLPNGKKINVSIDENEVSFDMNTAVHVGFVLNELVTNSIKYGANKNGELIIGISLKKINNELSVTYWDEGKGLEYEEVINSGEGFGFKLIRIMMIQLNSNLHYAMLNEKPTFTFKININNE